MAAPDTTGYKALVCVFLYGGNQSYNWIVPYTQTKHDEYSAVRQGLAIARNTLLTLTGTASDGNQYALHPGCPELQTLFNAGDAAVICNVGTLVQPTTKAQAIAGSVPLPPQLFSHIDQQKLWMTSIANSDESFGWGGRTADFYDANAYISNLSMNISTTEAAVFGAGEVANPYALGTAGAPTFGMTDNSTYRSGARRQLAIDLQTLAQADTNPMVKEYGNIRASAASKATLVASSLATAGDVTTAFPDYLGDSGLGKQLHMVARIIKARAQIGDERQVFFCSMGGYDTHNGELNDQAALLASLSKHIKAFNDAMVELGLNNQVTLFTNSDFGRTLSPNGDGSDHAWGGHSMVFGGAVVGGYYGTMPSLVKDGADDRGNTRLVPTTSTDQYAATLARWFGIANADLPAIFPNLANFTPQYLGFMG